MDDLLSMFSNITTDDHSALVNQFAQIMGIEADAATFFLEASSWNVEAAVNSYLQAGGGQGRGLLLAAPVEAPQAEFIGDTASTQGVQFQPGQPIDMVWGFRNTGNAAWPQDTHLKFIEGTIMDGPDGWPILCEAGEEVSAQVQLRAPAEPGEYMGSWRLICNHGYVGEPVWLMITVVEAAPARRGDAAATGGGFSLNEDKRDGVVRDLLSSCVGDPAVAESLWNDAWDQMQLNCGLNC